MNKVFKKHLVSNIEEYAKQCAEGFRMLSSSELRTINGADSRTVAVLVRESGALAQFIHVVSISKSDSQLTVEIGQCRLPSLPRFGIGSIETMKRLQSSNAAPDEFVVRLFFFCKGRGSVEKPWDLFLREVWKGDAESFAAYSARTAFAAVDEKIRVMSSGGITDEYASESAQIILKDIHACLKEFGIPLLSGIRRASGAAEGVNPSRSS